MASEHKKIVLRQLDGLDAFKFRMIKSLLDKELKLTDKMQEDYDIIKIANMLEAKFPKDAGVKKLIEVCKNMPSLENLADKLKEERENVQNKNKRKSNGAQRKRKQDEPSTPQPVPAGSEASKSAPSAKKKKKKTTETQGSKKQKLTKMQKELLNPSVTNPQKEDCLHIRPLTPSTKSSNSAIKKRRNKTIKNKDSKKMKLTQEQDQFPEPTESNKLKTEDCVQTPHKPSPTSSSNSSTKKKRNTEDSKKMKLTQEQNQLPESSVTNTLKKEFCSQTPHKPFSISFSNFLTKVPQVPPAALSMGIQAPQVPQVIASSGLPISHTSQSPAPSDILAPQVFPKPVSTHLLASQVFPGTTSSNLVPSMPTITILKVALSASEKWQLKSVRHSYMEVIKSKKQMTTNQP